MGPAAEASSWKVWREESACSRHRQNTVVGGRNGTQRGNRMAANIAESRHTFLRKAGREILHRNGPWLPDLEV